MKIILRLLQLSPHIQTIRLIGLLMLTLLINACSDKNQDEDPGPDPALGPKPVLWNLGVNFDESFTLEGVGKQHLKFFEFGWETLDSQSGELKALPHFTYVMTRTTEVISPMKGYVAHVHMGFESISFDGNDTVRDFTIHLKPSGDTTSWQVEFDHITKLTVVKGDEVDIGDLLGYPTLGGFELMVNGPHAHVCPWQVFAPEVIEETQKKLAKFLVAWDSAKWALPEDNYYHPENPIYPYWTNPTMGWEVPGCLLSEVPYPDRE